MDQFLKRGASYERLERDYIKYGSLAIGYDFDATVHDFHKTGESHEMVKQLIRDCKEMGFTCYCWTANPNLEYVMEFLKENSIPCDGVNTDGLVLPWASRKPFYSALLDDRAGLKQVYEDLTLLLHQIRQKYIAYDRQDSGANGISSNEQHPGVQL